MKTFTLFLDDERKTPDGFNVRTWTFEQTIVFLKTRNVSLMSLDHDLGRLGDWPDLQNPNAPREPGSLRKTGEDVLKFLEEIVHADHSFPIPEIQIHSANPEGARRMKLVLEGIKRIRERQEKKTLDFASKWVCESSF